MSLLFTLNVTNGETLPQSQIGANTSKAISLNSVEENSVSKSITDYSCTWYIIDKPSNSNASIVLPGNNGNRTINLEQIDVWGTYRIFCVINETALPTKKSEENPLIARQEHFVDITVLSSNNQLEKPAYHQRNWKEKYDKLVDIVESDNKKIKVLNTGSVSFTLPVEDFTQ